MPGSLPQQITCDAGGRYYRNPALYGVASCTDLRALSVSFDHAIATELNRPAEIRLQSCHFKSDNTVQLEVPDVVEEAVVDNQLRRRSMQM
jgi:hypothetical protein